jgi:hypothetical protein
MREKLTRLGARLVNRAQIPFEENASVLITLENASLLRCFGRIVPDELMELETEKTAKVFDVPIRDLRRRDTATICARRAINLIFHVLCYCLESALNEVVTPEPCAEASVLFAVLLPVALYLYEVC